MALQEYKELKNVCTTLLKRNMQISQICIFKINNIFTYPHGERFVKSSCSHVGPPAKQQNLKHQQQCSPLLLHLFCRAPHYYPAFPFFISYRCSLETEIVFCITLLLHFKEWQPSTKSSVFDYLLWFKSYGTLGTRPCHRHNFR